MINLVVEVEEGQMISLSTCGEVVDVWNVNDFDADKIAELRHNEVEILSMKNVKSIVVKEE